MSKYLIKRSVEKDGLPKVKDYFYVESDSLEKHLLFDPEYDSWYDEEKYTHEVTHYYEPITLPEII